MAATSCAGARSPSPASPTTATPLSCWSWRTRRPPRDHEHGRSRRRQFGGAGHRPASHHTDRRHTVTETPADEYRQAAAELRDVAPLIDGPLAGLADPV